MSFLSAMLLVALASAVMTFAFAIALRGKLVWFLALLTPLGVAYCLYWLPVFWSGQDSVEYSAWASIFIIPWFLAGACASSAVILIVGCMRKRSATHS
jgi:hypothetical protein